MSASRSYECVSELNTFQRHAKTFSFAAIILPKAVLKKAVKLYVFCRYLDDVADTTCDKAQAKQRLMQVQRDLVLGASEDRQVEQFLNFARKEGLNLFYLRQLIDGMLNDCEESVRMPNEGALLNYCYQVAGTVGALMCPLLGVKKDELSMALTPAIYLGQAMQLTNIARDIHEDAMMNRIYLPATWKSFDSAGKLTKPPLCREAGAQAECKHLLDLADVYYEKAKHGYPYLPFRSRACIILAAKLYQAIGVKIRRNDCRYWEGRQRLSLREKSLRAVGYLFGLLHPDTWRKCDHVSKANDTVLL